MTFRQEIFRALLLAFGATEIITNISYLVKQNGLELARKQHGELPPALPNNKIKVKVVCMLIFGVLFFMASLSTYILHKYVSIILIIPSTLLCLYEIIEALYYRYWKTFGAVFLTIVILISSILL